MKSVFDQADFDLRFEWGVDGIRAVGSGSAVIIVVDVLSSTSAIDICVVTAAQ